MIKEITVTKVNLKKDNDERGILYINNRTGKFTKSRLTAMLWYNDNDNVTVKAPNGKTITKWVR